uniref:Sprouty related EVH1 domain containing 3 n=1 Tax=Poecilia formosa TaxID=48698 RepID=A0A096LSN8_POEFO
RVRAVVMTRDDSSGGWVPLGGGGLSHVVICKGRSLDGRGRREYIIRGERLRDRAPVLECAVQRGLVYNKVNPIFHHWRVEDRKFGLTFQSPADAISFEKGLQTVLDKLDRGTPAQTPKEADTEDDGQAQRKNERSESSSNSRKEMLPKPITIVTSESSSTCFVRPEEFSFGSSHAVTTHTPAQVDKRQTFFFTTTFWLVPLLQMYTKLCGYSANVEKTQFRNNFAKQSNADTAEKATSTFGQKTYYVWTRPKGKSLFLEAEHQNMRHAKPGTNFQKTAKQASSSCSSRCVYCRSVFSASENGRGRCRDAPDPALHCLRQWTCVWCAESLLYHCMSDSEGEFWEPCSCDDSMGGHPHPLCCARWLALLALSLFVPCMCCYLPLRACLRCGERCGCCGGKHKAVR